MLFPSQLLHFYALIILLGLSHFSLAMAQPQRPISGIIAVSTAPVTITHASIQSGAIGRQANTGDVIFLNDIIETNAHTNAQILLKDQTVFSIGPNSSVVFDEFVFDPSHDLEPSLSVNMKKGTFKFISGKISQNNNDGMVLNLPNATASIRGTSVAGRVRDDGVTDMVLLSGAIAVETEQINTAIDIFTSGWGVTISPSGIPSDPVQFSLEQINSIIADVEFEAPEAAIESIVTALGTTQASDDEAPQTPEQIIASIENAETIEDVVEVIAVVLQDNNGTINAGDLSALLLANQNLLAASNIDLDLLDPESSAGVNIDAALIEFALAGGAPTWSKLLNDSDNNLYFGNDPIPNEFADLISSSYGGSARFGATGLALSPSGSDSGSGSATAAYDMVVDYDDLTINGSMSVYDIVLGGRTYNDFVDHNFASDIANDISINALHKLAQFELGTNNLIGGNVHDDENGNGILEVGEEFEAVQMVGAMLTDNNPGHNAFIRMNVSLGSISDGNNAIDGRLGGVEFAIEEIDTSTSSPSGNFINASHFSAGTEE